jgi:hypothetical protein
MAGTSPAMTMFLRRLQPQAVCLMIAATLEMISSI